jgi:hypothetical protein
MKHGTTVSINMDVLQCDFKNEFTEPDLWPTNKMFDFHEWRENKNYMDIIRPEDMVD